MRPAAAPLDGKMGLAAVLGLSQGPGGRRLPAIHILPVHGASVHFFNAPMHTSPHPVDRAEVLAGRISERAPPCSPSSRRQSDDDGRRRRRKANRRRRVIVLLLLLQQYSYDDTSACVRLRLRLTPSNGGDHRTHERSRPSRVLRRAPPPLLLSSSARRPQGPRPNTWRSRGKPRSPRRVGGIGKLPRV